VCALQRTNKAEATRGRRFSAKTMAMAYTFQLSILVTNWNFIAWVTVI